MEIECIEFEHRLALKGKAKAQSLEIVFEIGETSRPQTLLEEEIRHKRSASSPPIPTQRLEVIRSKSAPDLFKMTSHWDDDLQRRTFSAPAALYREGWSEKGDTSSSHQVVPLTRSKTTTFWMVLLFGGLLNSYATVVPGGVMAMDKFLSIFFPGILYKSRHAVVNNFCVYSSQQFQFLGSSIFLFSILGLCFSIFICNIIGQRWAPIIGSVLSIIGSIIECCCSHQWSDHHRLEHWSHTAGHFTDDFADESEGYTVTEGYVSDTVLGVGTCVFVVISVVLFKSFGSQHRSVVMRAAFLTISATLLVIGIVLLTKLASLRFPSRVVSYVVIGLVAILIFGYSIASAPQGCLDIPFSGEVDSVAPFVVTPVNFLCQFLIMHFFLPITCALKAWVFVIIAITTALLSLTILFLLRRERSRS